MIRHIISIVAAVLLILTFAACGNESVGNTDSAADNSASDSSAADSSGEDASNDTITGRVTAVSGSAVTLDVLKIPVKPSSGNTGTSTPGPDAGSSSNPKQAPGGSQDKAGYPGFESTGETRTVTVDDGTAITIRAPGGKPGEGQQAAGVTAGTVSDITVGEVIRVTLSDTRAVSVTIMNAAPAGPGAQADSALQAGAPNDAEATGTTAAPAA